VRPVLFFINIFLFYVFFRFLFLVGNTFQFGTNFGKCSNNLLSQKRY
jgi:hypothetical protein